MPIQKSFHKRAHYWLCLAIAFMLPLYINAVPLIIVLLLINWLWEGAVVEKIKIAFRSRACLLFISFYLMHLIGMLLTSNIDSGAFDLQVKLSILLFPILFASTSFENKKQLTNILYGFVYGAACAAVYCIGIAVYSEITTGENHFTYMAFSKIMHPSYFAMYLNFAVIILSYFLFINKQKHSSIAYIFHILLLLLFYITIVLCASKMGIATMLLLTLTISSYLIIKTKKFTIALIIIFGGVGCFYILGKILPKINERIENAIYVMTHPNDVKITDGGGSNSDRVLVWKASMRILKEQYLLGVGTGDVKDVLLKEYKQEDLISIYNKNLNPHNQFLQTFIALGIVGFILLICLFIVPLFLSAGKYFPYTLFLLLIFINLFVESMLEVQAGVIFYAFFNSILFFNTTAVRDMISKI